MGLPDPFEALGLPPTASKSDVKAAFRRLALRCHPDVDPSPQAAARFQRIKQAADMLLSGHYKAGVSGPGPSTAYHAWQAYAHEAAASAHDSRLRSRSVALWLCAAALVGGFSIFGFAYYSHGLMQGYTWLTPEVADERLRHPTPRRQQLMRLMVQQRQDREAGRQAAAERGGAPD